MVVKAKRETRKFERLKFWITVTLKWIRKKDKTEETNIFTTCKVLLYNSKEWGICVSKKDGGFEGMQRAHEGLKGLGKILQPLQKQYGHAQQLSQDTQSCDCEDKKAKQCQNINHTTRSPLSNIYTIKYFYSSWCFLLLK